MSAKNCLFLLALGLCLFVSHQSHSKGSPSTQEQLLKKLDSQSKSLESQLNKLKAKEVQRKKASGSVIQSYFTLIFLAILFTIVVVALEIMSLSNKAKPEKPLSSIKIPLNILMILGLLTFFATAIALIKYVLYEEVVLYSRYGGELLRWSTSQSPIGIGCLAGICLLSIIFVRRHLGKAGLSFSVYLKMLKKTD